MPVLTIHRSDVAILGRQDALARWSEWSFEPVPAEASRSDSGYRRWRAESVPVAVRVPPGAVVFDMVCSDGRVLRSLRKGPACGGIGPQSVAYLAARGEGGFRPEDDMGRKRRDDGPGLFDGSGGVPTEDQAVIDGGSMALARIRNEIRREMAAEAYDPAAAKFDAKFEADIAAATLDGFHDAAPPRYLGQDARVDALESACRRAVEQLDRWLADPEAGGVMSARAILEGALEAR